MDKWLNQIIEGDCLEVMRDIPDKSVDLVLTDPPYKLTSGGSRNSQLRKQRDNNPFTTTGECFDSKTPEFNKWLPLLYRVLKDDSYTFIMSNDTNLKTMWTEGEKVGFKFCEILVMVKQNKVPSSYFFKQSEFILMFRKGKYKKFNKYGVSNVFNVVLPRGINKTHPTEKTTSLMEPIIQSCSKENDIILDPFLGSGTTAVAAHNTGRKFIGIEKEQRYVEIARQRLEQAQTQQRLFAEA